MGLSTLEAMRSEGRQAPIAVDLDGTLLRTDCLHESLLELAGRNPKALAEAAMVLPRGKAAFKRFVATNADLAVDSLPINEELFAYLQDERSRGRVIGLFTAADQSIADAISRRMPGLFDVVRGSDGVTNLAGGAKAEAIAAAFPDGFVYIGDSRADRPVFEAAWAMVPVGSRARIAAITPPGSQVERSVELPSPNLSVWLRALRLPHWAKNILVFVAPILALPAEPNPASVIAPALMLFLLMGMIASATYLINDLLDLQADRRHPVKRFRPLASGTIPLRQGCAAAAGLIAVALSMAVVLLPPITVGVLALYLGGTLTYSLALKRRPLLDVVALAGLFTLRVFGGATLVDRPISLWFLTFSLLFFTSLAMVKRYAELDRALSSGADGVPARGYVARDLPLLQSAGVAAAFSSLCIFTIYLIQEQYPADIYRRPELFWILLPIFLLWLLRIWMLALRGQMNEDPLIFALSDMASLALGAISAGIIFLAWL